MRRALALTLLAAAPYATAQSSPWYLGTALSVNHDNNILRLGREQPPPTGESQADTVTSLALVGGIDQPVGRQRYTGSVTLRDNRFERNDKYNNQSYNGSIGWQWASINRLSGSLSAGASRSLSTFNADGVGVLTSRNYETTKGFNGSLSVGVVTEWSLELAGGQRQVRNSLEDPLVRSRDFDQNDASVGLAWRPSDLINFGLALREVQGTFPRFRANNGVDEEDRFKQQGLEFSTQWQVSGASVLDLRLSGGDTGYETNAARDFSSTSGSLGWSWRPTGRLRLTSRISRDDGRDNYPSQFDRLVPCFDPQGNIVFCPQRVQLTVSDRRAIDTVRLQADWELTAKVGLSSSLQTNRRSVERDRYFLNGNPAAAQETGTDRTTIFTLSARWAPHRSTTAGCELRDERRAASGTVTADLRGTSFSCYTQITLQ
jgi:hypothetical protein